MTRKLLSLALVAVFLAYAYHHRQESAQAVAAVTPSSTVANTATPLSSASSTTPPTPAPSSSSSSGMMGSGSMMGQYKDGSYTGSVADAFYGNVQVRVTVAGGKITDVTFLQHPSDRQTSQIINSQAMPMLSQEAIQAQSAQVDGVSGASATSQAFVQSLDSALQQAKA